MRDVVVLAGRLIDASGIVDLAEPRAHAGVARRKHFDGLTQSVARSLTSDDSSHPVGLSRSC
jgi:hypothetical protein